MSAALRARRQNPTRPTAARAPLIAAAAAAALAALPVARAAAQLPAATWNGGNGTWGAAADWSTNVVPDRFTDVLIDGGNPVNSNVTMDLLAPAANNLTISAGDALTVTNQATLSLYGNLTVDGLLDLGGTSTLHGHLTFQAAGPATIGGTGTISFGTALGGSPSSLFLTNNSTIGPGLLLHGRDANLLPAGTASTFLNLATVAADVAGGTVTLTNVNNAGSLQALNGGTLALAGAWHNTGTIQAGAGSTVSLGGTFSMDDVGTLTRAASSTITIAGTFVNTGRTLALNASTGSWLLRRGTILGGTITAADGAQLLLGGSSDTSTLDGVTFDTGPAGVSTLLNGASTRSNLTVRNGLTLRNGSVLDFTSGPAGWDDYLNFSGTNAQTIAGNGTLVGGSMEGAFAAVTVAPGILWHNPAALELVVNQGTVVLDGGQGRQRSYCAASGFTNQAVVSVSGGVTLQTQGSVYNAAGGTITVNGATLALGRAGAGAPSDTWHNDGTINLTNSTVILGGTFAMSDLGHLTYDASSHVSIGGILNNAGHTLALNAATGSWLLDGGSVVGGTVTARDGAQLVVENGTLDGVTLDTGPAGVVMTSTSPLLGIEHDLTLVNGATINSGTSPVHLFFEGPAAQTIRGNGAFNLGAGGLHAIIQNDSAWQLTIGPGILIHGQNLTMPNDGGNYGGYLNQGTVAADVTGGTFTLTSFRNQGTLSVVRGSTITLAGGFGQDGGVLLVNGSLNGPSNGLLVAGGVLAGGGTVTPSSAIGNPTVTLSSATLSPGDTPDGTGSIDTLTVAGAVTLTGGAHLAVELSGAASADLLAITNTPNASGDLIIDPGTSLDVTSLGGVAHGNTYVIVTYGGQLDGTFASVTPGYEVSYATPGEILVTALPEPASTGAIALAAASLLARRRRKR
jgi:filamentous hemagglutinin